MDVDDDVGEDQMEYEGQTNDQDQPHGRGIMKMEGAIFTGRFKNGEKHGRGLMTFEDGGSLSGVWSNDELTGQAQYNNADGTFIVGNFENGALNGEGILYNSSCKTQYRGLFKDNLKHGRGVFYFDVVPHCGKIEGEWEEDEVNGDSVYYYPDDSCLKGIWENGKLKKAQFFENVNQQKSPSPKTWYKFDPSNETTISTEPLLGDPYEQRIVYAKKSAIQNAGEGLFAKVNLPAKMIVSFYNGVKLSHAKADRRPWDQNGNVIHLDDEFMIDVPKPFEATEKYCATLGHKANHSSEANARYVSYEHPRFGSIMAIESVREIKKDEEITCQYLFKTGTGPAWYRKLESK